ncbi:hypothetical protein MCOR27_010454 [Pyricularia oryzae]|uniref:CCHC-type domain-containing protein n=1 Tax=Pyricularia grisea TaxID=148305 RepID=A0ABQ8NRZ6_PYRGI|nr:hypothetical protein MCOR01_008579 [Pyricularia oryzae]KAI6301280.1 hypothetical protein MCOR33_003225 [Pyricularia grisea]KAH9439224.1 hypothetical protein MCOR02_002792 [Pyricularia oryzae]KAI6259063.1 hypothetical protein MCOR19_004621 [Pyricularia oryzae]KAI6267767.1 hypothetical protein MCOR27_010454 [Pyricularia oryzae]
MSTVAGSSGTSSGRDFSNLSVNGQNAHFSKDTHYDGGRRRAASKSVRHYPLDLPGLSFEKYEHRRLGIREALVSRLVDDIMGSTRATYAAKELEMRSTVNSPVTPDTFPTMGEMRQALELERDLWLLEDMAHTKPAYKQPRDAHLSRQCGRRELNGATDASPLLKAWTLCDTILDLVQRHYIEVDEAATRQWFRIMRLPQGPIQPFTPKPPTPGALADPTRTVSATPRTKPRRGTRAAVVQSCEARRNHSRVQDRAAHVSADGLRYHRQSLERFAKTQDSMRLYDGGAVRPWNTQVLDFSRSITAHQISMIGHESITPMWPHSRVLRRFKVRVAWKHRRKLKDPLFVTAHPPFSPDRSRGPSRYYAQDGKLDNPTNRKRSLSEPPPGMFAHAKLPRPAHHGPVIEMEIAYPRLSLSQIDRRSRRRSLDHGNIQDMLGGVPIRGDRTLAYHSSDRQMDLAGNDGGSCARGLQDPCPSSVQKRRPGQAKGPMIVQRGVWCPTCDSFHPLSDLHNLTLEAGPVQTIHHSMDEIGLATSSRWPGQEERLGDFRSWSDALPPTEPLLTMICSNCTGKDHLESSCVLRCGHCGALGDDVNPLDRERPNFQIVRSQPPALPSRYHHAHDCEVPKRNRCKCVSFPTFHTAKDCTVTCSRPCGNPWPPGHFKHRNAMTCTNRCCMCGIRGHAGKDCHLTKDSCLCGAHHLGQDCGWKPECRVPGCDRYHCRVHCRRCAALRTPKGTRPNPALRSRLCAECTAVEIKQEEEQHAADATAIWSRLVADADVRYRQMDQNPAMLVDSPFELFRETLTRLNVGQLRDLFWPGQVDLPTGESNYVNFQISQLRYGCRKMSKLFFILVDGQYPVETMVFLQTAMDCAAKEKRASMHEDGAKDKQIAER